MRCDPEAREWLILKANAYYRPRAQGYTRAVSEAGRYTKAEAELHAKVEPWHMKALHVSEAKPIGYEAQLVDEVAGLRDRLRVMHRRAQQAEGRLHRIQYYVDRWNERRTTFASKGVLDRMARLYIEWISRENSRRRPTSPASPESLPSIKGLAAASPTIADPVKEGGR